MKQSLFICSVLGLLGLNGHGVVADEAKLLDTSAYVYQSDFFAKGSKDTIVVLDQQSGFNLLTCTGSKVPPADPVEFQKFLEDECEGLETFKPNPYPGQTLALQLVHQRKSDRILVMVTMLGHTPIVEHANAYGGSWTFLFNRTHTDSLDFLLGHVSVNDGNNPLFYTKRESGLKVREFKLQLPEIPFKPIEQ
jgi:hypothetical protein